MECLICKKISENELCDSCTEIKNNKKIKLKTFVNDTNLHNIKMGIGHDIFKCKNFLQLKFISLDFYALAEIAEELNLNIKEKLLSELANRYNAKLKLLKTPIQKLSEFISYLSKEDTQTALQTLFFFTEKYKIDTKIEKERSARKIIFELLKQSSTEDLEEQAKLLSIALPGEWSKLEHRFAVC